MNNLIESLPEEINNKVFYYLSHPVADTLRPLINKYNNYYYKYSVDFITYIYISYLNDYYDF